MRIEISIFIATLALCLVTVREGLHLKSHYDLFYSFHGYDHKSDRLYNGKRCELFNWAQDSCDPMFHLSIEGSGRCLILNKKISQQPNTRYISWVDSSTISTNCDLTSIVLKVVVRDHDRYTYNHMIEEFSKNIYSRDITNHKTSGHMFAKYHSNAELKYKITVKCSSYYYGKKCNKYCKSDRLYYNCGLNGAKKCYMNQYGPNCRIYCKPTLQYSCNLDGSKLCRKNYFGFNCRIYCIEGKGFVCDKYGKKICNLKCQPNGVCKRYGSYRTSFMCLCSNGWSGKLCNIKEMKAISQSTSKPITTINRFSTEQIFNTKPVKEFEPFRVQMISLIPGGAFETNNVNKEGESAMILQNNDRKNENDRRFNAMLNYFPPSTLIIIGLLVILCFCMIALVVIKKRKVDLAGQSIPSVLYETKHPIGPINNDSSNGYSTIIDHENYYPTKNITVNWNSKNTNGDKLIDNYIDNDESIYEQCRFDEDICTIQTYVNEEPYLNPIGNI